MFQGIHWRMKHKMIQETSYPPDNRNITMPLYSCNQEQLIYNYAHTGNIALLTDVLYDCNCCGGGTIPSIPVGLISEIAELADRELVLALLLAHGNPNEEQGAPLRNAIMSNQPCNVKLLLQAGARISAITQEQRERFFDTHAMGFNYSQDRLE